MNIYLLSQSDNRGYDTYDSCAVFAESEDAARLILPTEYAEFDSREWANCPENVDVSYMGTNPKVTNSGVILASFNAG